MARIFVCMIVLVLFFSPGCVLSEADRSSFVYIMNELSVVVISDAGQYGFFDKTSGFYQEPIYEDIYDICSDPSSPLFVKKNGFWGYIERSSGRPITEFLYDAGYGFPCYQNGYALVATLVERNENSTSYKLHLIDRQGDEVRLPDGFIPQSGVCGTQKTVVTRGLASNGEYLYGLWNVDGQTVVEPQYDEIWFGDCDFFCYRDSSGKIGVINATGDIVIEPTYYSNDTPVEYIGNIHSGYYLLYHADATPVYVFCNNEIGSISIFDTAELFTGYPQ